MHQLHTFINHFQHKDKCLIFLCFGLLGGYRYKLHYFKSDLMGWYFKHACVSNHTHKIIALHPAHPAFGLLSFRHHPRP